jgi:hypothetical protein
MAYYSTYSTFPFENLLLVGPGIVRAEYGRFLTSLPARRMYDVWQDLQDHRRAQRPHRHLHSDRPAFTRVG